MVRCWSSRRYAEYVKIFKSIFTLPPGVPMYYVPGNHDIPLVGAHGDEDDYGISHDARKRYAKHFGQTNHVVPIANHTFVLLDSIGLAEEDYQRYASEVQFGEWDGVPDGVIEFINNIGKGEYLVSVHADDQRTRPTFSSRISHSHVPTRPAAGLFANMARSAKASDRGTRISWGARRAGTCWTRCGREWSSQATTTTTATLHIQTMSER